MPPPVEAVIAAIQAAITHPIATVPVVAVAQIIEAIRAAAPATIPIVVAPIIILIKETLQIRTAVPAEPGIQM